MKICVTGAGGFVGGHLTLRLSLQGHDVRAVDIKPFEEWHQHSVKDQWRLDLRRFKHCLKAVTGCDAVYNLAASMGGMGFIETHKAECMMNVLINTHLLMASRRVGVKRYFFASSACVYNAQKQSRHIVSLRESDATPADPEDGYGWEKLFSERMCFHFTQDYGLQTRVGRYHNIYGPHGTFKGGREKAPAAICRKVIQAKLEGLDWIEIWGDGEQTRSFTWIEDCMIGTELVMGLDVPIPVNVGSSELVSINQLVSIVEEIAGVKLKRKYLPNAPHGVTGRSSDNTLIKKLTEWEPTTKLRDGMAKLYEWIYNEMTR